MRIVDTSRPPRFTDIEASWIYNGLDCCVTAEVLDALLPQLDRTTSATYDFSRSLQGPVFDMRIHGVLVDQPRRQQVLSEYATLVDQYESTLERIVHEGTGYHGFNWKSSQSLHKLLYDIYRIPPVMTKEGRRTANRDALEKMESYKLARPVIRFMEALRDLTKKMDVLTMELDSDGRMRTSYNIAGTSTGRFSSSFSEFGAGGNLQNIEEALRSIFIADSGMKLANFDAEQGESRVCGAIWWNLFHKGEYLDASETGDLHTVTSRLCEPDYGWTGDLNKDREIAEKPYYRHHSLRKLCKSIGHGTNYGGKPNTLNRLYKVDVPLITQFQSKYYKAYPALIMWHDWVATQLKSYGYLTSFTGRKRWFFGRRDSDDTIREAIAYDPQGSLADIVNAGMLRVWHARDCQLLMQNHDSILVQYPEEMEDEVIPKLQAQLHHEIQLKHGRIFTVPYGCQTGWNWGKQTKDNVDGLKTYKPDDKRTRQTGM